MTYVYVEQKKTPSRVERRPASCPSTRLPLAHLAYETARTVCVRCGLAAHRRSAAAEKAARRVTGGEKEISKSGRVVFRGGCPPGLVDMHIR